MGRLSRHKKIKSCDPFYKGHKEIDTSSNAPVKAADIDKQRAPRKINNILKFNLELKKKGKKDNKKQQVNEKLLQKPGETKKEYFARLDQQSAHDVAQIMAKEKHVSQKRKQFLKARKEKRSKKGIKEVYQDFTTDNVKFGEVVNEPPCFTSKPRRAEEKKDTTKTRAESLLLSNKLKQESDKPEEIKDNVLKCKKRKHMSVFEQQKSDKRRQEAIDAYRHLKKKQMVEQT